MCFYCDRNARGNPKPWWYVNYVCWTCRVQNGLKISETNITNNKGGKYCYKCHNQMIDVGFKFKTPKKNDIKQWKILEKTWEYQYIITNNNRIYVGPHNKVVKQLF
jgi:hypothetical protein